MYIITVLNKPGLFVSYTTMFNFTISTEKNAAIQFLTEDEVNEAMARIEAVKKAKGTKIEFQIIEL
jgi:hypothetical protein